MKIPVLHLEDGVHHFEGRIQKGKLHFYRDEIYPTDIKIKVDLNKSGKNITCSIQMLTKTHHICDRCLSEYEKDFNEKFEILLNLGEEELNIENDDIIIVSPEQKDVDLLPMIQENLILSIPMKLICKIDCKGICAGCGVDLNKENCQCKNQPKDPRWEKLSDLKEK